MASTEVLTQSSENLAQSNEVSKTENRPKLRDIAVNVPTVNANEHALSSPWVFWWLQRGAKTQDEWESSFHLLGAFASVEGFWNYYSAIARPHELKQKLEIYVFRHGMKPLWEDEVNKEGGKFSITTEKHETTEHWEKLLLALIGEQLDFGGEVCGIVLSSRWNDDHISIWVKDDKKNTVIKEKVTSFFSGIASEKISYKAHKDAIVDSAIYEAKMKEKEATNASSGHHHQNQNHQNTHHYRHNNQQHHGGHYNNASYNNQHQQQTTGNQNSENHQGRSSSNKVNRPYIPSYQLGSSSETEKTTDTENNNASPDKSRKPSNKSHEAAVVVEKDADGFTFVKHQRKQRNQTTDERSSNNRSNNSSGGNRGQQSNNSSTQSDYQNQKYQQYSNQNSTGMISLYPQRPAANSNNNSTGSNNNSSGNSAAAQTGNSFAALTDQ